MSHNITWNWKALSPHKVPQPLLVGSDIISKLLFNLPRRSNRIAEGFFPRLQVLAMMSSRGHDGFEQLMRKMCPLVRGGMF
jgi:hypothetical protein